MTVSSAGRNYSRFTPLRILTAFVVSFALIFGMLAIPQGWNLLQTASAAPSTNLVISQIYGAGGNVNASYRNDFIEIFNRGTAAVNLSTYSVQYTSSTGTGSFSGNVTALPNVNLQPGQYFLVQESSGGSAGVLLPTADATGTIAMAAGAGKVIIANTTTGVACNGSSTLCNATEAAKIVDLVGYGTGTNFFEGTGPTGTTSITNSAFRAGSGCTDTDNNATDFSVAAVAPRNTATALNPCTITSTNPSGIGAANPNSLFPGDSVLLTVNVTGGTNPASTGLSVTGDLTSIGSSATQQFFDDGTNGDVTSGDKIFSFATSVTAATMPGPKSVSVSITDAQSRLGTTNISLTVNAIVFGEALPFTQNWSNTNLITADDNWSNVPGIVGYRGDGLASGTGVDPQTVLSEGTAVVDVIANQSNVSITSGGVAEFELADPVVAFQGSGTAKAPNLVLSVNTSGQSNITVFYTLRDIDDTADNSVQPVALQYRVGNTGNFTNVPAAFVSDASGGPNDASLVTPVAVVLPAVVNNKTLVQLRIITTDALGSDEWIGVDDIQVVANGTIPLSGSGSATPNRLSPNENTVLKVRVNAANNPTSTGVAVTGDLTSIGGSSTQQFFDDGSHGDAVAGDNLFSYTATVSATTFSGSKTIPVSITDGQARTASSSISLLINDPRDPQSHLVMGNPSGAVADINNPNNYLLAKNEYVVGYNRDRGTPNWVSWHLDQSWIGTAPRQDDFRPDDTLPSDWYHVTQFDYSGSGFDRGHHTPSADRTATIPENSATFLMTNMMPQAPDNNQGPWEELESYTRTLLGQGNEMYIVAGGTGTGGTGANGLTQTIAGGHVTVPAYTWKAVMVLPNGGDDVSRVNENTRVIAVIMPNVQGIRFDAWQKYIATVDQIEALTGYDLFSNVPTSVQDVIESRIDPTSNTAPTANSQTVGTDEDNALGITLTATDPNVNNVLTYAVTTGPLHGSLSGTGANLTYTPEANYNGLDSFQFEVNDGGKTSNTATVSISVASVNDAPGLVPIPDQIVNLGDTLTFTAMGVDVDLPNDTLSYALVGTVPTGASINPISGVFTWTPTASQVGSVYPITVRVSDAGGLHSDQVVNVGVAYTWSDLFGSVVNGGPAKAGSSMPIKFKLTGASSAITNAQIRLFVAPVVNGVVGTEFAAVARGNGNQGNLFAYDSKTGEYYFIWNTSGLSAGTYQLRIDTGDGVVHTTMVTLK